MERFSCLLLTYSNVITQGTYFAAWKSLRDELRKQREQKQTAVWCHKTERSAEWIRLVFRLIFSLLQVGVLCLVVLLRVLEAHG